MTDETSIQVVKSELCIGCGTCIALCPNDALELTINENKGIHIPKLDEERCNNCGICYKVCPGHEVDFKGLNLAMFGKEPEDVLIGNYLNCYIGHATDYDIQYNSASGGLITQLLIFALEEGIIDGALVTRMKKDKPLEPEPFIARTKEEIIEASKSKYCPVPANIALKEILDSKEGERFAVVGLPCHIHGIRKAEMFNKKLKEKIVLHFGIFCSNNRNFLGTEFILQRIGIRKEDVIKLDYRGEGWPGGMSITLKNGNKKFIKLGEYYRPFGLHFFTHLRCTLCIDGTCELADISFGDAWLPELADNKIGVSIIISRSKIGNEILQSAISKKKIELNETSSDKVVQSQFGVILKKKAFRAHIFSFKMLGKEKVPIYNSELLKSKLTAYLIAIWHYLAIYTSSKRYLWGLVYIYTTSTLCTPLRMFFGYLSRYVKRT